MTDQISEIMALVGVPPREQERARGNFAKLGSEELTRRLRRLQDGEQRLARWRRIRPALSPEAASAPSSQAGDLDEPAASVLAALGAAGAAAHEIDDLIERVGALGSGVVQGGADRVRRVQTVWGEWLYAVQEDLGPSCDVESIRRFQPSGENIGLAVAQLIEWRQGRMHPVLRARRMAWTDVVPALARLENAADRLRPDLVIGLNDEGLAVARTISAHLRLPARLAVIRGSAETDLDWRDLDAESASYRRVLLLGHLAWSGATMARAIAEAQDLLHADEVVAGVLAASSEAASCFAGRVVFHQLTGQRQPELGIDVGRVSIDADRYTFRLRRPGAGPVTVTGEQLDIARADVASSFPPHLVG